MRKWIRKAGLFLCLCLSVFLLMAGMIRIRKGSDFFRNLTIQSEEGVSGSLLEDASGNGQEEKIPEEESEESGQKDFTFTAWTECKNEFVSDEFSGRRRSADIIAICGSSRHLLPFGKNISSQDEGGCIIGREIAEELFGSYMAEGHKLSWRDRIWTVRGVVEEPADILMVQAAGMEEMTFDRISVLLDGEDRRLTGERFISRYGIVAQPLRFDYFYPSMWMKELVPDKWSDFSGWKQNFREYREAARCVQNVEKSVIEAAGLRFRREGMWYVAFGVCVLFLVLLYRKDRGISAMFPRF